ncbi:hypothetical protein BDDG_09625 [Blastomyces dermatitidis ATCC 18188]|uniref:Uncharacterized protein n=1 Tax=Ajellomyces dermatitidis (strain ATCC 18188 / CBS 674.68) TaxID=653446 RepID=F2TTW4_AJEDA|nr:hypothetical protein BDDG_09625 [Blastomyces dermatitidis ATCC 18188]
MAAEGVRDRSDTDKLTGRRNNTSLQDMTTIITVIKEAGEEEDVIMKAVLSQLIDTAASAFNLAFLAAMKAATTS